MTSAADPVPYDAIYALQKQLEDLGCAVILWVPDDFPGASPNSRKAMLRDCANQLIDTCINHGSEFISALYPGDDELTAEQLDARYNPDGGYGGHPAHSRADWRDEVFREHTVLGYWDWVAAQIEQAGDD